MENELHNALAKGQFNLYYQPIIDLKKLCPVGVEALIRWNHPTLGLITPNDFIPLAEETGFITDIGARVLETACAQLKKWNELGMNNIKMAVNISAKQFKYGFLSRVLKDVLNKYDINHNNLELELTESILMNGGEELDSTLENVIKIGLSIALDDFGTGYSSIGYLRRFPIKKIKIDKSFVLDLINDKSAQHLITAIISMSKGLDVESLAEGIETKEQLLKLRELGCSFGQGYLIAQPLPESECTNFLRTNRDVILSLADINTQ